MAYGPTEIRLSCDELFGPAAGWTKFDSVDAATASNSLSAVACSKILNQPMRSAREVHAGNIDIFWGTHRRARLICDDSLKEGGCGEENPQYPSEEMMETKIEFMH